jgi:peptidyl-prolyl cis-trans isomerase C
MKWFPPLLAAISLAAGCRDGSVLAEVGASKLREPDLELWAQSHGGGKTPAALEALAKRAQLAEAARKQGLADDPKVRARIAAAEREALAQAYVDATAGSPTDADLRKRYDERKDKLSRREVHVAQLLAAGQDNAAEARANRMFSRAAGGEAFDKIARESSDDKVSGARGGDLGKIREGQVDPQFFEAAARLKAGELGRPVRTASGYHVLKALEDPTVFVPEFEQVRGQLAADLRRAAEQEAVARAQEKVTIQLHPERLAQGGAR